MGYALVWICAVVVSFVVALFARWVWGGITEGRTVHFSGCLPRLAPMRHHWAREIYLLPYDCHGCHEGIVGRMYRWTGDCDTLTGDGLRLCGRCLDRLRETERARNCATEYGSILKIIRPVEPPGNKIMMLESRSLVDVRK